MSRLRNTVLASGLTLGLGGCAGGVVTPPVPVDDLAVCTTALLSAGSSNPAVLFTTAIATPACQRLAGDALQLLINAISKQQLARGIRR